MDLDDPEQRIGRISRASKWEVTSAMWNPHKSHAEYFVTATNLKVRIYFHACTCVQMWTNVVTNDVTQYRQMNM